MNNQTSLFDRFGGVRKMAGVLGEPITTVQSWKAVGRIPAGKQRTVLSMARSLGLSVSAEDIIFPFGCLSGALPSARVVLCAECERRIDDGPVVCTARDCPHLERSDVLDRAA